MKTRRHHNNRGDRQVRTGKTRQQVAAIARRLGVPEKKSKWYFQITAGPGGKGLQVMHPDLAVPTSGQGEKNGEKEQGFQGQEEDAGAGHDADA